jgi:hypothetical protein
MNKLFCNYEASYIKSRGVELVDAIGSKPNYLFVEKSGMGGFAIDTIRSEDVSSKFLVGPDTVKSDLEDSLIGHIWFI